MQTKTYDNGTTIEAIKTFWRITYTELRSNPAYVHGYSLIGSTIIMVVIPGKAFRHFVPLLRGNMTLKTKTQGKP